MYESSTGGGTSIRSTFLGSFLGGPLGSAIPFLRAMD